MKAVKASTRLERTSSLLYLSLSVANEEAFNANLFVMILFFLIKVVEGIPFFGGNRTTKSKKLLYGRSIITAGYGSPAIDEHYERQGIAKLMGHAKEDNN
ncbi:hypothetical protein SLE2022_136980 [Rubroshorea leprosula]